MKKSIDEMLRQAFSRPLRNANTETFWQDMVARLDNHAAKIDPKNKKHFFGSRLIGFFGGALLAGVTLMLQGPDVISRPSLSAETNPFPTTTQSPVPPQPSTTTTQEGQTTVKNTISVKKRETIVATQPVVLPPTITVPGNGSKITNPHLPAWSINDDATLWPSTPVSQQPTLQEIAPGLSDDSHPGHSLLHSAPELKLPETGGIKNSSDNTLPEQPILSGKKKQ